RTSCLAPPPPPTSSGTRPGERAPQKVEGCWTFSAVRLLRGTPPGQPSCRVRMEGQSEASQSLAQYRHYPRRIVLAFKADDAIITVPDQGCLAPQPWLHLGLAPQIEHVVHIDITEKR